ncbi:hypothetical protein ILUMI_17732 [Ignelater luminosus]|uniref:Uncharacterized protein n=1 Tax=Ignelater luminosus TaxID=2038154 RepID=A0A8K0CMR3_IGNLU|nr:hypothetical protein ILUMI_17732 [Ignelater luminosus]
MKKDGNGSRKETNCYTNKKGTFRKLINKSKKTKQATTKVVKRNMNKDNEKIAETEKQANKDARQKEKRTAKNKATVDKEQMKIMFVPTWNVRDLKDKERGIVDKWKKEE